MSLRDIEWAFGLNRWSLRLMGAWPEEITMSSTKKFFNNLKLPMMAMIIFIFVFLPQIYALSIVRKDFPLVIDNVMTSIPTLTSCFKLIIFWSNNEVLRPVINLMYKDWLKKKQKWEYNLMKKSAFPGKLFTVIGYSLLAISYACFVIFPICKLNIRLYSNKTDIGRFPMVVQSAYPFRYDKSPIFELLHLSQITGCTMIAMAMAVPDHYFGIIVFHLSGQFQILGIQLENIILNDEQINCKKKFISCIVRHVKLIKIVKLVEKKFNLIVFNQVLCLCVMAPCMGFRILYALKNPSEVISTLQILNLFGGLIFILVFTLNDCAASESLVFSTSELSNYLYKCNWYSGFYYTRDIIIMMTMTKKPLQLTSGKLLNLSLITFCSIVKSIGGYLSVLFAQVNK